MANDRRPFDPLRRPRRRRRVRSDRQRRPPRAPRLGLDSARAAAAQARAARAQPAAGARPPVVRLAGRLSEYRALLDGTHDWEPLLLDSEAGAVVVLGLLDEITDGLTREPDRRADE